MAEHTVAESYSGDGMIAASFDRRDADLRVPISYARAGESLFGEPLDDLAAAERARRDEAERAEAAIAELAAIKATTTWQLRGRLVGSPAGRALLRRGGRVLRRMRSVPS